MDPTVDHACPAEHCSCVLDYIRKRGQASTFVKKAVEQFNPQKNFFQKELSDQ